MEIGPKSDETYQIHEDTSTSVESHKVAIPLFANQQIVVDFNRCWRAVILLSGVQGCTGAGYGRSPEWRGWFAT